MRLGILGGTFDPVHEGHLAMARAARDQLSLGQVLFLPAGQPWRKSDQEITPAAHRRAMLDLALDGERGFAVSTLELDREGPSYTADTLAALRAKRPDDELSFILGEDALADMPNWLRPERIIELATLAVAPRGDVPPEALAGAFGRVPVLEERTVRLEMPVVKVSATEVRERVRRGEPIEGLVPAAVAAYIREQGLYRA